MLGELDDEILGLFHIMNRPICQDQHHLVLRLAAPAFHHSEKLFKQGCKVCWSCKLDFLQRLAVCLSDPCYAIDGWLLCISIDREAVTCFRHTHASMNATKAESGKHSVVVIRLAN